MVATTDLIPPPPPPPPGPPARGNRWIWWVLGAFGAALIGAVAAVGAIRFMDDPEPVRATGTWLPTSERQSTTTTTIASTPTAQDPTTTTAATAAPAAPPTAAPTAEKYNPPCPQGEIVVTNARLHTVKSPPDHYGYEERSVQGEITVVNNTDMAVEVTSILLEFETVTGYRNSVSVYPPPPHPEGSAWIPAGGSQLQQGSEMLFSDDDLGPVTLEEVDLYTVSVLMDWEGGWVTFHCGDLVTLR